MISQDVGYLDDNGTKLARINESDCAGGLKTKKALKVRAHVVASTHIQTSLAIDLFYSHTNAPRDSPAHETNYSKMNAL